MGNPLWIINASLLLMSIATLFFIFFSRPSIPPKVSIDPTQEIKPIKKEIVKIDLKKIITNDLFNTFKQPPRPEPIPQEIRRMPEPPVAKLPALPPVQLPKFLEPLGITLRGIIIANDEHLNTAVIEDNKDKLAKNYRIGDMILDAQLIRIFKNKIILIRSNGQQEILYMSKQDVELEQLTRTDGTWADTIKLINATTYTINPVLFSAKVKNIARFIDLLNISTVYKQGKSFGVRIGKTSSNGLVKALGLMPGDIITTINNISTTTVQSRFEIYEKILSLQDNDTIDVNIIRKNMPLYMHYQLKTAEEEFQNNSNAQEIEKIHRKTLEENIKKIAAEKEKFSALEKELQKKEKRDMFKISQGKLSQTRDQSRAIATTQ